MSYILDALRKAERERRTAAVPTLADDVPAAPAPHGHSRVWPWLGVALLIGNGAFLYGLWQIARRPAEPPAAAARSAPSSASTPPVSHPPAAARPADAEGGPLPGEAAGGRAARATRDLARASGGAPAASTSPPGAPSSPMGVAPGVSGAGPGTPPPRAASSPGSTAATASRGPDADRIVAESPPQVVPPTTERRPVEAPVAAPTGPGASPAPGPQAGTGLAAGPAARGEAMGATAPATAVPARPGIADALPHLTLDVLVFSELPAERLVFINGRKYVEGQVLEGGIVLEQITPEGAVLRHEGRRLVLRPKLNPYVRP